MDKAVGAVSLLAMAPAVVAQATTTQNQLLQILQHVDRLYEENQMQEALAYLEPLAHWEDHTAFSHIFFLFFFFRDEFLDPWI